MAIPLKWKISADGGEEVKNQFSSIREELKMTDDQTKTWLKTRSQERRIAREILNQDRYEAQIWLAKHKRIRDVTEAMGLMSRVMRVAVTAQTALNLVQLVTQQKTQEQLALTSELAQAERHLSLMRLNGASDKELAEATEQVTKFKEAIKAADEQAGQDKINNIIQLVTTFGFLGSSMGHIVGRAPQFISLLRRLTGGRGSGGFGGAPSFPSGFGGGSTGGVSGATPIIGGRCMSMCQETVTRLGDGIATPVASKLGQMLPTILPVAAGTAIGAGIPALIQLSGYTASGTVGSWEEIKKSNNWLQTILSVLAYSHLVWVQNFPTWFLNNPFENPIKVELTNVPSGEGEAGFTTKSAEQFKKLDEMNKISSGDRTGELIGGTAGGTLFGWVTNWLMGSGGKELGRLAGGAAGGAFKLPNIESWGFEFFGKIPEAYAEKGTASAEDFGTKMGVFNTTMSDNTTSIADSTKVSLTAMNNTILVNTKIALTTFKTSAKVIADAILSEFKKKAKDIANAQIQRIRAASSSSSGTRSAAVGLDAMITKPTSIRVGEAGAERVKITPLGGSSGGGNVYYVYSIKTDGILAEKDIMRIVNEHHESDYRRRNIGN